MKKVNEKGFSDAEQKAFDIDVNTVNHRRMLIGLGIHAIMNFFAFGKDFINRQFHQFDQQLHYDIWFWFRVGIVVVSIVFFLVDFLWTKFRKPPPEKQGRIAMIVFFCFIFLSGLLFALYGQSVRGQIESFILVSVILSAVFYLSFIPYFLLIVFFSAVLIAGMAILQTDLMILSVNISNSILTMIISLFLCVYNYRIKLKEFRDRLTIERQKQEIEHERLNYRIEVFANRYGITKREREMIVQVLEGKSNEEIASESFISLATVKSHIHHIYEKIGIKNRIELYQLITSMSEESERKKYF